MAMSSNNASAAYGTIYKPALAVTHVLKPQAVSNWRSRGIPFAYRAALALEAGSRDIGVPENFLGDLPPEPEPVDAEVPFLSN